MASFSAEYPPARRLDLVDDLFGHQVADPYRWLEDADSAPAAEWLVAEETLWARYRDGLTERGPFAARVSGTRLRGGMRMYRRSRITEGVITSTVAECSDRPPGS